MWKKKQPAASKSDYGDSCQEQRDLPYLPTALSAHPPVHIIIIIIIIISCC